MTPDLKVRLLAALAISLPMGQLVMGRSKARLAEWTQDPAAAQAAAVERLKRTASGTAFLSAGILCVGLVVLVELIVSLLPLS